MGTRFCALFGFLILWCSIIQGQTPEGFECRELIAIHELLDQEELDEVAKLIQAYKPTTSICEAELVFLHGSLSLFQTNFQSAQLILSDALNAFKALDHLNGVILTSHQLALAYVQDGKTEKATKVLDEVLLKEDSEPNLEVYYKILDLRAMLYSQVGAHEQAMELLKRAVQLIRLKNDPVQLSDLLNQISTNYQSLGQTDSAIHYFKEIIKLKEANRDESGLLSDFMTLGGLYRTLGQYKMAQAAFIEGVKYAEALQDTFSLMTIYIEIANVFLDEYLYDPALEYTENALMLAQAQGMTLGEGQCYGLKGNIFEAKGNTAAAYAEYEKALKSYETLGLKQQSADTQMKMVAINPSDTLLHEAEKSLRIILNSHQRSQNKLATLDTKILLCQLLLKQDKGFEEVEKWLQECTETALGMNNLVALQEVFRLNSLKFEKQQQYNAALDYFKKYNAIQDSLVNQDNAKAVKRLEKQFETVKKDKEIAEQQSAIEQQNQALKIRTNQIFFLILGILFFIALSILIAFINRRNKQLNEHRMFRMEKEQEAEVLRAMVAGEEQERIRIARDLHDGLGAIMATIKMRISALGNKNPDIQIQESYQKAESLLDDAYQAVREFTHNMVPGPLQKFGLELAIADMCEAIEAAHSIQVDFIPFGLDGIEDDRLATNIFRIIQELLQNVVKHAQASEVIVQLTCEDQLLSLIVEDNGIGFDHQNAATQNGLGIGSIKSRVLILKGKLEIDSLPQQGTTFSINIPLNNIHHG